MMLKNSLFISRNASEHAEATVTSMRLFERLPQQPMITLARTTEILDTSKPTAGKAIDALRQAGVLTEITGKKRDRVYAYREFLAVLSHDTEPQQIF